MLPEATPKSELIFSEQVIQEQIQKIFNYRLFAVSVVLRNFLSYIVNETISGRANDIKEYNIAVDVLGRPAGFRTVHSGIVRVHAGRLRRALNSYYREQGIRDICIISIPTGRYVPVFKTPEHGVGKFFPELKSVSASNPKGKIKMAVMPFHCFEQDIHRMTFADSIGLLLTESLGFFPDISMISYFTTHQVKKKSEGIQSLVSGYDLDYAVSGNVHFEGIKIRVNFQLIQASNETQLYSKTYSLHFAADKYFALSEMIASRVLTALGEFHGWPGQQFIHSREVPFETHVKREKYSISTDKRVRKAIAG